MPTGTTLDLNVCFGSPDFLFCRYASFGGAPKSSCMNDLASGPYGSITTSAFPSTCDLVMRAVAR